MQTATASEPKRAAIEEVNDSIFKYNLMYFQFKIFLCATTVRDSLIHTKVNFISHLGLKREAVNLLRTGK